ncbi:uncharacterized protein LOC131160893 [Malania oleifera]|uniref:uncharacterized protein LOC131160893 n=1 Tax=Malania oleifera TaxID=397392 RepID=UPI0025ADB0D2|nr:uncharacterized protein LOC131160893 [Malania oleifera]
MLDLSTRQGRKKEDLGIVGPIASTGKAMGDKDKRLLCRYEGPIKVIEEVAHASYRLEQPKWMKSHRQPVHPVFHVSNLKSFHVAEEDLHQQKLRRSTIFKRQIVNRDVKEILGYRVINEEGRQQQQYLVKWMGLGEEENSWEKAENLRHATQKIQDFRNSKPITPASEH